MSRLKTDRGRILFRPYKHLFDRVKMMDGDALWLNVTANGILVVSTKPPVYDPSVHTRWKLECAPDDREDLWYNDPVPVGILTLKKELTNDYVANSLYMVKKTKLLQAMRKP